MSTKKLQILGSFGNKVYTQNEEPIDAIDGAVWIDMDDDSDLYLDADTLDGKHASEFAFATDMGAAQSNISDLQTKVGDTSVSDQIATGIANKVDKVDGKGLSTHDYTTTDKDKLSGIAIGAEVNQNTFSNITIGDTTIFADAKTDTLTFEAGSNVVLTPDVENDKITIAVDAISNDLIDIICAD